MKGLREFKIDIFNLSIKQHEFEFNIDNRLFGLYEHSLIEKGTGTCKLILDKTATMMTLNFTIEVTVELLCDRSLDPYDFPIHLEERLIIKFGEENYSLSEDVIVIKSDSASIDVSEYIYEYISLAVPLKKLHPRFQDEEDDSDEPELIYTSETDPENDDNDDNNDNPLWDALKKLKDN